MTTPATNAQDVVAVLNSSFAQVFTNARAIKAAVDRGAKIMEHPIETGVTISDHRVILPVSIELSMLLTTEDYPAVYQQVVDLFRGNELLIVQTRVDSFPDMAIEKMPHEESTDVFDGVALALTLRQALIVTPQFSALPPKKVAAKKDADTAKRGQQQPTEPAKGSILSGWFK